MAVHRTESGGTVTSERLSRYASWAALVVGVAFTVGSFADHGVTALNAALTVAFWAFVPGCALVAWILPGRLGPSDMIAASIAIALIAGWVATVGGFVASDWTFRGVAVVSVAALVLRLAFPAHVVGEELPPPGEPR